MRLLAALAFFAITIPPAAVALEPLDAEALRDALAELIADHPTAKRTNVALKVTDLETGEILFDHNSDKLFTPASNLKIYTSAAALDLLGPEYLFEHEIRLWDLREDGVVSGWVRLNFDWDPMLTTDDLARHADRLIRETNLKEIRGTVRVGRSTNPMKGPGWMWDDDPDYYNMNVTESMLNFNVLRVKVAPGDKVGEELKITLIPTADTPEIWRSNTFTVSDPPREDDYDRPGYVVIQPVEVDRQPFKDEILVTGQMGINDEPVESRLTMHSPERWMESVYTNLLRERGVIVGNSDNDPDEWEVTEISFQSDHTAADAIKHFLKVSENAVGEMMLLKMGQDFRDQADDTKEDWPRGAEVISDWLIETAGLEDGSFRLVDGSGLSRYNLISADSSIRLLTYMKNDSPHFEPFFDGLPVYKVNLPDTPGEKFPGAGGVPLAEFDPERVFAKPGGMSGVSTISGYIQTLDGRWLAFSLLGNGYIGSSAPVRDLRNQVWAELVRYQPAAVPAE